VSGANRTEDLLRRVLHEEAETIEVAPDALGTIRSGLARNRRRRWLAKGGTMIGLGMATAGALAAVAIGTATCAPPAQHPAPIGAVPSSSPAVGPTSSMQASPAEPPATSGGGATANLAVYYFGPGNRLFREFHRIPAGDGSPAAKIRAALTEMMRPGSARDPDYHSVWDCQVRGVTVAGRQVTVSLASTCPMPADLIRPQQLVWTATQIPGIDTVVLGSQQLHRMSSMDILAPIWIIDPQQKAVTGRAVTVTIDGTAFEAAAVVRIRDIGGKVVVQRSVHVGSPAVPNRASATLTVTLAPGRYTVEGFVFSARDGSVQNLDNHQFTVR
jgi:hypothetical protein